MRAPSAAIRVVLIDGRAAVREGLRLILTSDANFDVVAVAEDAQRGMEAVGDLRPDVVLVGVPLGAPAGGPALRLVPAELSGTGVVILTDLIEDESALVGLQGEAVAYLVKDASADEVRRSVRAAASGRRGRPPRPQQPVVAGRRARDLAGTLTPREFEVLVGIAAGKPNLAIAAELGITAETVKTYVKHILSKLGVRSRTAAAVLALTSGLVPGVAEPPPDPGEWGFPDRL